MAGKCSIRWLQHLMCQVLQTQFSVVQSGREKKNKMKFFNGGRGNFEEKSCMYILYAIYNGVSRIQLTVYLGGWKESKEGEGYLFQSKKLKKNRGWRVKGRRRGRWKGFWLSRKWEMLCSKKIKIWKMLYQHFHNKFHVTGYYLLLLVGRKII